RLTTPAVACGQEGRTLALRPARPVGELPHEVAQADDRADEESHHHAEARERERADGTEESADVAAERQHGAAAEHRAADGAPLPRPASGNTASYRSPKSLDSSRPSPSRLSLP